MNNKGLTLVEVIAVLVILSIIAVVVTPNVVNNLNDYEDRLAETQLSSIEGATKNWVADNIDKVSCTDDTALLVSLKELQDSGYIDDNLKNPNGGTIDPNEAFGLVYCSTIIDETGNLEENYKYEYGAYMDIDDYIKKMAIKYVKDNGDMDTQINVTALNTYLYNNVKDTSGSVIIIPNIPNVAIKVSVTETEIGTYEYKATLILTDLVNYIEDIETKLKASSNVPSRITDPNYVSHSFNIKSVDLVIDTTKYKIKSGTIELNNKTYKISNSGIVQ